MESKSKEGVLISSQSYPVNNGNVSKKRIYDQITDRQNNRFEDISTQDSLMAIYRDNFCSCSNGECKNGLQNHFRKLMK